MNSQIKTVITILRKGPNAIEELTEYLNNLTLYTRKEIAKEIQSLNIPAPQVIFYHYPTQTWLI